MKKYNKEIPLLSIHIPKTGGTSFEESLKIWFEKFQKKQLLFPFIQGFYKSFANLIKIRLVAIPISNSNL